MGGGGKASVRQEESGSVLGSQKGLSEGTDE